MLRMQFSLVANAYAFQRFHGTRFVIAARSE
jgi:hypothetical protein